MAHFGSKTERTERMFRPFLQKIPFHNPDSTKGDLVFSGLVNDCYSLLGHKQLHLYVIKRQPVENRLGHGLLTIDGEDCYTFKIFLSPELFYGARYDSPKLRKAIGVHEFVHCVAAAINIPKIKSQSQKQEFKNRLHNKLAMDIVSTKQIEEMQKKKGSDHLMQRLQTDSSPFYPNNLLFEDGHYRLPGDDSLIKYHDLYDWFLLSRDTFEDFFNQDELNEIKQGAKGDIMAAYKTALKQKEKIIKSLFLYDDFVVRRIAEIMVFYAKR
ncbi:MAG: hypothetical protein LBP93_04855 [Treponema sp.]|jgi:hypothetical protein|nr:hypothetical protein [Treponema sp.]